jgi:hypothetical protein
MDASAIVEGMFQKYWKEFVGMFGAAVSSRLAWKHGPMKISSRDVAKILYRKRQSRNRDSPLDVRPLGEVLLKLGEIDWHFRPRGMKMDEGDEEIRKLSRALIVISLG